MKDNLELAKHLYEIWMKAANPENKPDVFENYSNSFQNGFVAVAEAFKNMVDTTVAVTKDNDPIMRYIDVLKDRVSHLEDSLERYESIATEQDKIIHSYRKMTGIVISIDNDAEREDNGFS